MKSKLSSTFLFLILFINFNFAQTQNKIKTLQVPGIDDFCIIKPTGASVLPSGRFVTPAGKVTRISNGAFGLALSPDQKTVLVLHNGVITVVPTNNPNAAVRVPSYDKTIPSALKNASFLGAAFDADNQTAYLSGGDNGNVIVFDTKTFQKISEINLDTTVNGEKFSDSFTSDLTINRDKNELLVLDRANKRLVKIDLKTKNITASIPVGRIPFGIALTPDGKTALVANVGLFDYPLVPGVTPTNKDSMMLQFPAYGHPSKEAEKGITLPDGRKIPGLGSALADEAMSVWTIDLEKNTVKQKFKTGFQIGEKIDDVEIVGGASPNSIAVGSQFAYVANATNDNISIIDHKKGKLSGVIQINIDKRIDKYRGFIPFGLCLSSDEKTLYTALLGFNAVAVIDLTSKKVKGLIPTGWGTTRVSVQKNETTNKQQLIILSARGYGAGPNGGQGFVKPPQGTYIGDIQLGTMQIVEVPDETTLARYTQQVLENTFRETEIPDDGRWTSRIWKNDFKVQCPIKHIVYVTKENRTYDEIFGQLTQAKGDSTLARFGLNVKISNLGKDVLKDVNIMPNHLKAAQQFAFSDNFYCDSDASIHGHHWMMGTIPNEYVEANSATESDFKPFSKAPGRRFPKTTGAIDPEDYNEIGGIWENLERNKIDYYNFGEANEYTSNYEKYTNTQFGAAQGVVFPMPKNAFDYTSRNYAGFNTNVPDQFRMDQFESEFTAKWLSGKDTMPQLITMQMPNDHGSSARASFGYPYLQSYMADNDLALGRLLNFLSRTKYWNSTLVIITEDDPQGGVDHIDAHRSVLMMAGPYIKHNYVSHRHGNFGSILKVIYNILKVPYVNQYDATASLLNDFFVEKPDFSKYNAVLPDNQVFDPQKAMDIYKKTFDWQKIIKGPKPDDINEMREEHYRQQKNN